jgi:hypothetical protein
MSEDNFKEKYDDEGAKDITTRNPLSSKFKDDFSLFTDQKDDKQHIKDTHVIMRPAEEVGEEKLEQSEIHVAEAEMDAGANEIDDLNISSKLRRALKKLAKKVKKPFKFIFKGNSYINNDRAPSLGNEGMSESSLSAGEIKKRHNIINYITSSLLSSFRKASVQNVRPTRSGSALDGPPDINDINRDGRVDTQEKGSGQQRQGREEFTQKYADAINNLGENKHKGKWVPKALQDSHIKGDEGRGR